MAAWPSAFRSTGRDGAGAGRMCAAVNDRGTQTGPGPSLETVDEKESTGAKTYKRLVEHR
jgi:hypothetical protein